MDEKLAAARRILGKDSYTQPGQDVLEDARLLAREHVAKAQRQPDFIEALAALCKKHGVKLESEIEGHYEDAEKVWTFVGQDICVQLEDVEKEL